MTTLTPEQFESICGGTIPADRVTPEMLALASTILKSEATRINALPSSEWYIEPIVDEIETSIPGCRDRHVQAVLTVAEVWGEDDFGTRV